jgi:hypothetical protein
MTKRFKIEVMSEDTALIDEATDVSFTLTSTFGANGVRFDILETLDEDLASLWASKLDGIEKPYVTQVLDGNILVSKRSAWNPKWLQE